MKNETSECSEVDSHLVITTEPPPIQVQVTDCQLAEIFPGLGQVAGIASNNK